MNYKINKTGRDQLKKAFSAFKTLHFPSEVGKNSNYAELITDIGLTDSTIAGLVHRLANGQKISEKEFLLLSLEDIDDKIRGLINQDTHEIRLIKTYLNSIEEMIEIIKKNLR